MMEKHRKLAPRVIRTQNSNMKSELLYYQLFCSCPISEINSANNLFKETCL